MRIIWVSCLGFVTGILTLFVNGCAGTSKTGLATVQPPQQVVTVSETDLTSPNTSLQKQNIGAQIEDLEKRVLYLNNKSAELENSIATMTDRLRRIEDALTLMAASSGGKHGPAGVFRPTGYDVKTSYEAALQDYKNNRFDRAIGGFSEILSLAPKSDFADNAQYWIGECYYSMENFRQAIAEFQKVFNYAKTEKDDDAQLKTAMCYQRLGNKERAIKELKRLISDYPDSEYITEAKKRIEELENQ